MTWKLKLLITLLLLTLIAPGYAENRALLIGIDRYQHAGVLKGSKQDVKDMQQFIQSVWYYQPDQIRTLTDAQATRQGILTAFEDWLIKGSRAGDRVLFYFSGHGYYIDDDNGDESDGYDETILPVEATDQNAMIIDDEMEELLQRLTGREVTVIIDACHSGTLTRGVKEQSFDPTVKVPFFSDSKQSVQKAARRRGIGVNPTTPVIPDGFISSSHSHITAYSAVAPDQEALVDTEKPYRGVFTSRFIQALQEKRADKNRDGKITHAEVLEYVRRESQAYCDRQPEQCDLEKLTPQLEATLDVLMEDALISITPGQLNAREILNMFAHDNQAQLQVQISPKDRIKLNDAMQIQVKSEQAGYLLLFDVNNDGELTRLFPNKYSRRYSTQGYLKAGQQITLPEPFYGFEFVAVEPLGKGVLIAFLIEENQISTIQSLLPTAFEPIQVQEAQAVLQTLRNQLNQTSPSGVVEWSIAVVDYEIVR
jgi:hypothetical protein